MAIEKINEILENFNEALFGKKTIQPGEIDADGVPFIIVKDGHRIESLKRLAPPPLDRRALVAVGDVESFVAYVNDYKDGNSRIFVAVDASSPIPFSARCYLDYHEPTVGTDAKNPPEPHWGLHHVTLNVESSEAWRAWNGKNGQALSQEEFADFIEERAVDFVTPSASDMMTMAQDFKAIADVKFDSKINRTNGSSAFTYKHETEAAGNIECPEQFAIFIPLFIGGGAMNINVRLRFRINRNTGELAFLFKIADRVETIETYCKELASKIIEDTALPVHRGMVEIPDFSS